MKVRDSCCPCFVFTAQGVISSISTKIHFLAGHTLRYYIKRYIFSRLFLYFPSWGVSKSASSWRRPKMSHSAAFFPSMAFARRHGYFIVDVISDQPYARHEHCVRTSVVSRQFAFGAFPHQFLSFAKGLNGESILNVFLEVTPPEIAGQIKTGGCAAEARAPRSQCLLQKYSETKAAVMF